MDSVSWIVCGEVWCEVVYITWNLYSIKQDTNAYASPESPICPIVFLLALIVAHGIRL